MAFEGKYYYDNNLKWVYFWLQKMFIIQNNEHGFVVIFFNATNIFDQNDYFYHLIFLYMIITTIFV